MGTYSQTNMDGMGSRRLESGTNYAIEDWLEDQDSGERLPRSSRIVTGAWDYPLTTLIWPCLQRECEYYKGDAVSTQSGHWPVVVKILCLCLYILLYVCLHGGVISPHAYLCIVLYIVVCG